MRAFKRQGLELFPSHVLTVKPPFYSESNITEAALIVMGELMDRTIEVAAGIAKNRAEGVANIKSLLIEHTGEALENQFQTVIEGRKGRYKGLTVEDGFKDFLDRKGRKPRVS